MALYCLPIVQKDSAVHSSWTQSDFLYRGKCTSFAKAEHFSESSITPSASYTAAWSVAPVPLKVDGDVTLLVALAVAESERGRLDGWNSWPYLRTLEFVSRQWLWFITLFSVSREFYIEDYIVSSLVRWKNTLGIVFPSSARYDGI